MVDLISLISEEERDMIHRYIVKTNLVAEKHYMKIEDYLLDWSEGKQTLYHAFGDKLTVEYPIKYEQSEEELKQNIYNNCYGYRENDSSAVNFQNLLLFFLYKKVVNKKYPITSQYLNDLDENDNIISRPRYVYGLYEDGDVMPETRKFISKLENLAIRLTNPTAFAKNVYEGEDYEDRDETTGHRISVKNGEKPFRALQKLIKFYGDGDELSTRINTACENLRNKISTLTQNRVLSTTLILSIHPMDFITMSDNASNWSSCMNWTKGDIEAGETGGCYHAGTLEMMNSDNTFIAFTVGKNPYKPFNDDDMIWNNKTWRQLFYAERDFVISGKAYPASNSALTKTILEKIRELFAETIKWEYKFGVEQFFDMDDIRGEKDMDDCMFYNCEAGRILIDTKMMYNDLLNDHDKEYFALRNPIDHPKRISVSGPCRCVCCGTDIQNYLDYNDYDYDEDYEDHYNSRYETPDRVVCYHCLGDYCTCELCGSVIKEESMISYDNANYCPTCWQDRIKCPDCGDFFFRNNSHDYFDGRNAIIMPTKGSLLDGLTDDEILDLEHKTIRKHIFYDDADTYLFCACPECTTAFIERAESNNLIKKVKFPSLYSWSRIKGDEKYMLTKPLDLSSPIDKEFLERYSFKFDF